MEIVSLFIKSHYLLIMNISFGTNTYLQGDLLSSVLGQTNQLENGSTQKTLLKPMYYYECYKRPSTKDITIFNV